LVSHVGFNYYFFVIIIIINAKGDISGGGLNFKGELINCLFVVGDEIGCDGVYHYK
jgi:hypothetical protein